MRSYMEFSKTFLDIIYDKTCFLCFKIYPDMTNTTEVLEIHEPYSNKSLKLSEIVQYLFPAFDIISRQSCRACSDLLIKMYVTIYKNNFIKKLIYSMTKHCIEVIDKKKTENPAILNFKLTLSKDKRERDSKSKTRVDELTNMPLPSMDGFKHKRKKRFYFCEQCSYKSLCKGTLKGHINKYHIKIRPFTCEVCNKSFYTKSNLTEHKQSHMKLSVCDICGDIFARRQSLNNHLKLHTNNRSYKCLLCDKSFINSSRQLDHMKRSHLKKNECCMFCDKIFAMKKELMRHVKNVHA